MTLRYCIKCKEIVDDKNTFVQNGEVYHTTCRYTMLYFGAEKAYLSPKEVLAEYDKTHTQSPLETFKGRSYIIHDYNALTTAILECRDMLLHRPDHIVALRHLMKLYRTQGSADEFIKTADQLLTYIPNDLETHLILAQHYKSKENFELAMTHLQQVFDQDPGHVQALELRGFIEMRLKTYSQAYSTFMDLAHRAEEDPQKQRFQSILRHLQNEIEDPKS